MTPCLARATEAIRAALRAWDGAAPRVLVVCGPPQSGRTSAARAALAAEGFRVLEAPAPADAPGPAAGNALASFLESCTSSGACVADLLRNTAAGDNRRAIMLDSLYTPAAALKHSGRCGPALLLVTSDRPHSRAWACVHTAYPSTADLCALLRARLGCSHAEARAAAKAGGGIVPRSLLAARIPTIGTPALAAVEWVRRAALDPAFDRSAPPDAMLLLVILSGAAEHMRAKTRRAAIDATVLAGLMQSNTDALHIIADAALAAVLSHPDDRKALALKCSFPRCYTVSSTRARNMAVW